MAGHSKFKNIMHRKNFQDKKRAKIFTRIIREISIAANIGLPDPNMNARLRSAIESAKEMNIPKNKIEYAIKKAKDDNIKDNYEDICYEGYGLGKVAIIVEASTNNKNRTASEVRAAFTKYNGLLGENGSVNYMFDKKGVIKYDAHISVFNSILETTLESGADNCTEGDVENDDGDIVKEYFITCDVGQFALVKNFFIQRYKNPKSAEITWLPNITLQLNKEENVQIIKLIEALENIDDVYNVITNASVVH